MNNIRMEQQYHLYTTLLPKFQVQSGLIYIRPTFHKLLTSSRSILHNPKHHSNAIFDIQ